MRIEIEIGQIVVDSATIGSSPEDVHAAISDQITAQLLHDLSTEDSAIEAIGARIAEQIIRSSKP